MVFRLFFAPKIMFFVGVISKHYIYRETLRAWNNNQNVAHDLKQLCRRIDRGEI